MALKGLKVIEMFGLAPGPFCGTILADFGASVTVVHKIKYAPFDVMTNGKKMLSINLKTIEGQEILTSLCTSSDIFLDTYRPGVMESLGLGPDILMEKNPKLIYARLTGYGQKGQYSQKAGHDLNYVSMSGVLSLLSKNNNPPQAPLNLLADFGGGSLNCVLGILLALFERSKSGLGQVVDASMTDGAAYLASWVYKSQNLPIWTGEPGTNVLDGGAHYYSTYRTKDNKFMAVAALEPIFYIELLKGLQLNEEDFSQHVNNIKSKKKFEKIFITKTQEEWCNIFEKLDACVTPVLDISSVINHACNQSRESFYRDSDGTIVPEPAPRLSRTPGISTGKHTAPRPGHHTKEILTELGYSKKHIEDLISKGCAYSPTNSNL